MAIFIAILGSLWPNAYLANRAILNTVHCLLDIVFSVPFGKLSWPGYKALETRHVKNGNKMKQENASSLVRKRGNGLQKSDHESFVCI